MKLRIILNKTDSQVFELIDDSRICSVLIATFNRDAFAGEQLDNDIEHAIDQQGFAEIESIKIRVIK